MDNFHILINFKFLLIYPEFCNIILKNMIMEYLMNPHHL